VRNALHRLNNGLLEFRLWVLGVIHQTGQC
jgi:hypothetical protein